MILTVLFACLAMGTFVFAWQSAFARFSPEHTIAASASGIVLGLGMIWLLIQTVGWWTIPIMALSSIPAGILLAVARIASLQGHVFRFRYALLMLAGVFGVLAWVH